MKRVLVIVASITIFLFNVSYSAHAGRIVLANDEWTLSNSGFGQASTQPGQFALNTAQWFSGSTGDFLVYSNNFGLTGSSLQAVMVNAGYTWTITGTPTDPNPSLSYLQGFDAVFLAGNPVNNSTLTNYVNGGGNVFLEGGTGSINEPAVWNTFLNAFGLGFGPNYNGVAGNMDINSSHPIFAGVSLLYQNNGNDTLDINLSDPRGEVLVTFQGHGLYAVYDSGANPVSEPSTMLLLGFGLIGLWGARRKMEK